MTGCCKLSKGAVEVDLLVVPKSTPHPNLTSFADFVDRALGDVRQVIVAEHVRLLHVKGASTISTTVSGVPTPIQPTPIQPIWELGSARQKCENGSSDEKKIPCNNLAVECGTQTKVDWTWPSFNWHHDHHDHHHWHDDHNGADISPFRQVSNDSVQPGASEGKIKTPNFAFANVNSEKLKERASSSLQLGKVDTMFYQQLIERGRKEPMEMLDAVMGFVIILNAIAIGASCDTKDWETGWLVIDSVFAAVFILESVVKVRILGCSKYLCGDLRSWSVFEVVLILISLFEIGVSIWMTDNIDGVNGASAFRVLRLVRLTKLIRLCRVHMAADLDMMVNGLIGGIRTLIWAIVLITFPLYVFGLIMRETLGAEDGTGNGSESFSTLPKSCFNTFRCFVVEDCADETGRPIFVLVAARYGWAYAVLYSAMVVALKFGLYNVIIAIFVEQTVQAAKYNDISKKRERLRDQQMFHDKALELAELAYSLKKNVPQEKVCSTINLEEIQSLELSNEEFNALCKHNVFKELLGDLDVAEEDHLDLFDTLDVDGGGSLDLGEIVSGIGKLRGDPRKADIVAVILMSKHLTRSFAEFRIEASGLIEDQSRQLASLKKSLKPLFHPNARGNHN